MERFEAAQPLEAVQAFGSLRARDAHDVPALLGKLWSFLSGQSSDLILSAAYSGAELLLAVFLSVLCCALADAEIVSFIAAVSVSLVCINGVSSCYAVGKQALQTLSDYSHVLLPCLATAAAAGGAWTSASAKYAASTLFLDLLISAEQGFALPLLYGYAATVITASLTEHPVLTGIAGLIKQLVKWSLILLTTCFTVYLSVTGILSGTVDAAAAKTAKTVIAGALPVVGKIISDASSAILSGVQMIRNGVGVIGLLAILAVCASPYLTLGSHYLVYQIVGSLSASFGDKRIGNVIKGVGDIYAFLLGIVGSVSIMLFVSVISLMKAVNGT